MVTKTHDAHSNLIKILNNEIISFDIKNIECYQSIIDNIGKARIVLLGEASHGTKEFYQTRIELTKRLIIEKGFHAIAIEADWTAAYPIHQYINSEFNDIQLAFKAFNRFPKWMWHNETLLPFINWMRDYNKNKKKISFYGLDLYCLYNSINTVINYFKKNNSIAAKHAMERYACFDHTANDPQSYGYMIASGVKKPCIKEAVDQLIETQHLFSNQLNQEKSEDELFFIKQNARLIKNAEHYYRAMFDEHAITWNIRDQHMIETLHNIVAHIENKLNEPAKIIIWAHNSHIGDARATEMSSKGEVNLGQLVREQFPDTSYHLGFSTYTGTVTAASQWGEAASFKKINNAIPESYEAIFHELKYSNFILNLRHNEQLNYFLQPSRLQRAIGVIYRPDNERISHYFFTHLPLQFDAIIHFDKTNAVRPL